MGVSLKECSGWRVALIVGSLLSYIFAVGLNAVLNNPGTSPFNTTIGNQSHKYPTGITPSNATFAIWGLIYLWQLVLVVYCMTLLCRRTKDFPLYISPEFIPSGFFVWYIINFISNPAWIVAFLQDMQIYALALLALGLLSLIICLATSCVGLEKCGAEMKAKGLLADIWCTRIIVQNGIALYMAWVSLATAINTVVVLCYHFGVAMETACLGALGVINAFVVGWFIVEAFIFDRQLRYVFGHYIAYIIAFVGVYTANYDEAIMYTKYELGLLILVSVLAFVKLIIIIVRSIIDPIHYPSNGDKFKFDKLPSSDILAVHY